jgi:putative glutamine amidotransferase
MNTAKPNPAPRPVVLVPACNRMLGPLPSHVVGQKYVDAVRLAGCMPLLVPYAQAHEIGELLALADGVLLTGSPSNVHPSHFGEPVHNEALPLDPQRDHWTLPLIPQALALGVPLMAICRGFQEMNVALGGSLHQAVQEVPGQGDHRSSDNDPIDVQFGPAHEIDVQTGGLLAALGLPGRITVNSLHGQGIKRMAPGLRVEAQASHDGLIEAFSQPDAPAFNLGVQWHPEWQAARNPISMVLFKAFGQACQTRRQRRSAHHAEIPPDR